MINKGLSDETKLFSNREISPSSWGANTFGGSIRKWI
jgi:hypothetical protein